MHTKIDSVLHHTVDNAVVGVRSGMVALEPFPALVSRNAKRDAVLGPQLFQFSLSASVSYILVIPGVSHTMTQDVIIGVAFAYSRFMSAVWRSSLARTVCERKFVSCGELEVEWKVGNGMRMLAYEDGVGRAEGLICHEEHRARCLRAGEKS